LAHLLYRSCNRFEGQKAAHITAQSLPRLYPFLRSFTQSSHESRREPSVAAVVSQRVQTLCNRFASDQFMAAVLLIDDDIEFASLLTDYLQREGFDVTAAHDGETGVVEALSGRHSIAVLDVMMPRVSGIEVLRRIRLQSTLPTLMLTAKGDDTDRIVGLELGADDYIAKPCTPRELTARLRAVLRRTQVSAVMAISPPAATAPLIVGALILWPERRRAEWQSQPLHLTSTEFSLLEVLVREAGKIVTKNELSEKGLGRPHARFDRNIDVHLSSIRHKLGLLPDGRSCIQTVFRKGYQLIKA
jgi:two-component system, OmpR family, response regulator